MTIRVLFFGRLRDAAGAAERQIDLGSGASSIDALIERIAANDGALHAALAHPSVKVAVDQQIVERDAPLTAAREIAFLPPFSGG